MKAAQLKERPCFPLMKQTDIQSMYYMQMPRWLFSDPHYAEMSLEAKVVYTFLLNRFQLSRRKGWINDRSEVFVIFPRKALAKELRVGEKRVIAAMRALTERKLVWEKRCGRGEANQIYLAKIEPVEEQDYECAPFHSVAYENGNVEEVSERQFRNCRSRVSRTATPTIQELPDKQPSKKEGKKKEKRHPEAGLSVGRRIEDEDEIELTGILEACELDSFAPQTAKVFESAIERLFFSECLRIGNAVLPQSRIRARLRDLDGIVLREAEARLADNLERSVSNSLAYTMATIFNCITECDSDLLVDPYLNRLRAQDPPGGRERCPI